jgi:hypothetical protein
MRSRLAAARQLSEAKHEQVHRDHGKARVPARGNHEAIGEAEGHDRKPDQRMPGFWRECVIEQRPAEWWRVSVITLTMNLSGRDRIHHQAN